MDFDPTFIVVPSIFLGLPWIVLHYITKWKAAAAITPGDESLLDELYNLARRLDERMDTVERLVATDNADFKPTRLTRERDDEDMPLQELEMLLAEKKKENRR